MALLIVLALTLVGITGTIWAFYAPTYRKEVHMGSDRRKDSHTP
ncbi:hypothetical protein [Streptomyces violaceusniger]